MTLGPEALAMLGTAPSNPPRGRKVMLLSAGDGMNQHSVAELRATKKQENTMPRGQYVRKPKTAIAGDAAVAAPAPPKPEAKAAQKRKYAKRVEGKGARVSTPRFGVFEDGTVHLALPKCTGAIAPDDALALVAFIQKFAS